MNEPKSPIAVVGVSALFPGTIDSTGFWKDILAGTDRITDVPATHWLVEDYYDPDPSAPDRTYARRGGFLPEVDFDPMAWGVPPSVVPATDTCQLLALVVAQQVLDDASNGQFSYADRERMSVILGVTSAQELLGEMNSRLQRPVWTKALREMGLPESQVQEACERIEAHYPLWQEATFPGVLGNVVAGRIANRLDLGGTNCVTDAACASTFAALSMAVNELRAGESDVVICGGADTMNDIFMYLCFSKTPALSKTGDCRPFSRDADGTMLGEGLGMVALKRLAAAEQDGDRIYAVLRGVGSGSDGGGTAVYAPVPMGQARAIRRAYAAAGFGPETVELIEAHGTGTVAGDAAEFEGLRTVFDECGREDRPWCGIGSVKSQIGHTKAAAGAAGLLKAIFALHHRVLPPTIKVDAPNPALELGQSPFYVSTRARPWIRSASHPRRAGVSSFGFGGSNFHVALEEYVGPAQPAYRRRASETELFVFTGESAAEVASAARKAAAQASEPNMFSFLARESQRSYEASATCRLAVVAKDAVDLAARLETAAQHVEIGKPFATPDGSAFGVGAHGGEVGFVFPGQGSQYVDMGAAVAMTWDVARAVWDTAADLEVFDEPLHRVVFPLPVFDDEERNAQREKLTATEWAQPAIGATSLSYLALMRELGVAPAAVAGHSFGEVIALHAAGVLSEEQALRVARGRGELMARAATRTAGAMSAVSMSAEDVRTRLDEWRLDVVIANHNAPTQVVLSGRTEAIEMAEEKLAQEGVQFRRLPVATAFHSSVVSGATEGFGELLQRVELSPPSIPVFGNSQAAPYPGDPEAIRSTLANQLAAPVRFVESVEAMYASGVRTFVEVGPGSVLGELIERILAGRPHLAVSLDRKGANGLTSLNRALARLVAAGVPLDLARLWQTFAPVSDPRTDERPRLTLKLTGANYGKHYPPPDGARGLPPPNPETAPPAGTKTATTTTKQEAQRASVQQPASASAAHREVAPAPDAPAMPPPPPPVAPGASGNAWAGAYHAIQAKAIEAHTAYTQAMAASHAAFLQAQARALETLPAMVRQDSFHLEVPTTPQAPRAGFVAASPTTSAAAPAPERRTSPPPPETSTPDESDLTQLLLEVVAEKTGYPIDMLDLGMDIAGDLGVDSIKRVEILAAVQDRVADLPEMDPAELGKLRTLQEIVDRMNAGGSAANAESAGVTPPATRWALHLEPTRATGFALAGLGEARSIAVVDGGSGIGAALAERLANRNVAARAAAPDESCDGVIFLGGLAELDSVDHALRIQRDAFAAARTIAARPSVFVTVQDTGGDFGMRGAGERAWLGGLPGLAKTASQEWPEAGVRALDVERGGRDVDAIADAIAFELLHGGSRAADGGIEIGLRADGSRHTTASVPSPVTHGTARVDDRSILVASGGARGVTAAALIALAEATRARFVLLGRTPLEDEPPACADAQDDASVKQALLDASRAEGATLSPAELGARAARILAAREARRTVTAIERAGGQARYIAADVCDGDAVGAALAKVRRAWGPITGIVHGAGVLADKRIADKTPADFDRVFDVKVRGLQTLLDATANDPITTLIAFSSVAARRGNTGQCDYAMANETLNKVLSAEAARRPGVFARSLGWGPWAGGMVTPALRVHFARLGVSLIPVEDGARMFVDELTDPGTDVELVLGQEPRPGGLAGRESAPDLERAHSLVIDRASFPAIADHVVKGKPVLPLALVLEIFARAVEATRPDLVFHACEHVRVLRGVPLDGYDGPGDWFTVRVRPQSNGDRAILGLELADADGQPRYSARGVAMPEPASPGKMPERPPGLTPFDGVVYDGVTLFQGGAFQVIVGAPDVGDAGVEAVLQGAAARGWNEGAWQTDPALLDGGLQLASLWTLQGEGGIALPTSLGTFRRFSRGLAVSPLRARLVGTTRAADRSLCSITFVDASGAVFAELRGVEMHVLPGARARSATARA